MNNVENSLTTSSYDLFRGMRNTFGLTQAQMGKVLGVSNITIQNWEKEGRGPLLTAKQNETLAEIGVNPLYWCGFGNMIRPGFHFDHVKREIRKLAECKS